MALSKTTFGLVTAIGLTVAAPFVSAVGGITDALVMEKVMKPLIETAGFDVHPDVKAPVRSPGSGTLPMYALVGLGFIAGGWYSRRKQSSRPPGP